MRKAFGLLAILFGAISVVVTARYGYKNADTEIDALIAAAMFGSISICAFMFDGAAVHLWFKGHRVASAFIGLLAAAALVVTFSNSLGGIAGRGDVMQAERTRIANSAHDDQAELRRVTKAIETMERFTPTTAEGVKAARDALKAAEDLQRKECADGRGKKCQDREAEERARRQDLNTALANQALTDRAAKLEQQAAAIRTRLATTPAVQSANPLGATLEALIGAAATVLTAWQQAIIAAVFELCLVGVMVVYEVLGHDRKLPSTGFREAPTGEMKFKAAERVPAPAQPSRQLPAPAAMLMPAEPRVVAEAVRPVGSVREFIATSVEVVGGAKLPVASAYAAYTTWCIGSQRSPVTPEDFYEAGARVCAEIGIPVVVDADVDIFLHATLAHAELSASKPNTRRRRALGKMAG